MSGDSAARVHYFDRQFLRVDEFRDEQLYQLSLRRRHNNTQHTWGIVNGLEIADEEGAVVVKPGLAIDGYGRELLLQTKFTVVPESFDDLATDRLDLWLVYDRQDDGSAPEGYAECGTSVAGKSYRSTEHPHVRVERPLTNTVDARRPPGVAREVLDAPLPPLSDDRAAAWRVYLGRVVRQRDGTFSFDLSSRPYAGVVAEAIDHPANAARLELGRDSKAPHSRTVRGATVRYRKTENGETGRRFAVFVPEDMAQQAPADSELAPRVEILEDGQIGFRGQTVVHGNLRVSGGAVQFVDAATFAPEEAPAQASMYRYVDADNGFDELRIDLGTGDPRQRKFVIGFSSAEGKFSPCLSVELKPGQANELIPSVTVFGNLQVLGTFPDKILPVMIGPEAMAAARAAFTQGLTEGTSPS